MAFHCLNVKYLVKCYFSGRFDSSGENVSLKKNSVFLRKGNNYYVNCRCIFCGMNTVDNRCGKACGKCGKVEVFHKETGSFPNLTYDLSCINGCIKPVMMK